MKVSIRSKSSKPIPVRGVRCWNFEWEIKIRRMWENPNSTLYIVLERRESMYYVIFVSRSSSVSSYYKNKESEVDRLVWAKLSTAKNSSMFLLFMLERAASHINLLHSLMKFLLLSLISFMPYGNIYTGFVHGVSTFWCAYPSWATINFFWSDSFCSLKFNILPGTHKPQSIEPCVRMTFAYLCR